MERIFWQFFFVGLLLSCKSNPVPVDPISNFDIEKYSGNWYEIARIDNRFEKGLTNVKVEYKLMDDYFEVIKNGINTTNNTDYETYGKAILNDKDNTGHLKVSFWGPWYGNYIIFYLDKNYQYAFISGGADEYLWLLAREPKISNAIVKKFKQKAKKIGFDTTKIIMVDQEINISKLAK